MKSCRKIVSVSYVTPSGVGFHSHAIPNSKVIKVSDLLGSSDVVDINTFLSAVERSLVQDFTSYYDKFDAESGISYDKITKSNVTFEDNTSIVYSGSEVQSTCNSNLFCIRQLGLGSIRSFEVGLQDAEFSDLVGRNMTEMSIAMELQSWVYLERLIKSSLGWSFVEIQPQTMKLKFNFVEDEDRNRLAKAVYLLLSEIVCYGCSGLPLTVLISEMPSDRIIYDELLKVLENLKYDCQVFIP